jgi:hypothetical protein
LQLGDKFVAHLIAKLGLKDWANNGDHQKIDHSDDGHPRIVGAIKFRMTVGRTDVYIDPRLTKLM